MNMSLTTINWKFLKALSFPDWLPSLYITNVISQDEEDVGSRRRQGRGQGRPRDQEEEEESNFFLQHDHHYLSQQRAQMIVVALPGFPASSLPPKTDGWTGQRGGCAT